MGKGLRFIHGSAAASEFPVHMHRVCAQTQPTLEGSLALRAAAGWPAQTVQTSSCSSPASGLHVERATNPTSLFRGEFGGTGFCRLETRMGVCAHLLSPPRTSAPSG